MVVLRVYLKFAKRVDDKKSLHHSGNHTFREPDGECCDLSCQILVEEFTQGGWELLEAKELERTYVGGLYD